MEAGGRRAPSQPYYCTTQKAYPSCKVAVVNCLMVLPTNFLSLGMFRQGAGQNIDRVVGGPTFVGGHLVKRRRRKHLGIRSQLKSTGMLEAGRGAATCRLYTRPAHRVGSPERPVWPINGQGKPSTNPGPPRRGFFLLLPITISWRRKTKMAERY